MAKQPKVIVSEHAILRYVERILGLDLVQLKSKLERQVAEAARIGATSFTDNGATFIFEKTPDGSICVVTVLTDKMRRGGTHGRTAHKRQTRR